MLRPCWSPTKICTGTSPAATINPARNVFLALLSNGAHRSRHAESPATTKDAVSPEAISMCVRRYGNEGLKITFTQSWAIHCPSANTWPAGVCIQELSARIQNAETVVPNATTEQAAMCTQSGTRFMPKSMMPRKVASRKKAVSTSYERSGPAMAPTVVMYRGQLVPNWKDIVTPVTTPIAKVSAKIFSQSLKVASHAASRVRWYAMRKPSRYQASAIVNVGNMMWNPMFSPNWARARRRASSMAFAASTRILAHPF